MSGQQIGAVVGGIIGAFFGMPQLGAAIGGMIGGWISPTQVNGPHIGDGAAQNSAEGQPIAWILGTAGWVQGNIVQISARREVKKTDDGKGSGTEVNTLEAHQDFCIMICESSETRQSLMVGVLIVKVDGKIVYDKRPGKNFGAENNKFLRNHRFYDGNEAQLPDPTMEAVTGVGNTPAYRGVYTMVARDINLSQYGERIPNYEFVMVGAGEASETTITSYAGPRYGRFVDEAYPLADSDAYYTFTGYRTRPDGSTESYAGVSKEDVIAHFSPGFLGAPNIYLGYSAFPSSGVPSNSPAGLRISNVDTPHTVVDATGLLLIYQEFNPSFILDVGANPDACPLIPVPTPSGEWYQDFSGNLLAQFESPPTGLVGFQSCADSVIWGIPALFIQVNRKATPQAAILGDPCLLGVPVLLPDDPSSTIDCAGVIAPTIDYTLTSASFKALQAEATETVMVGGVVFPEFTQFTVGPIRPAGSSDDNETFWTNAYNAAVISGYMPPGLVYNVDYPDNLPEAFVGESTTTGLTTDTLGIDTAITRIVVRGGLTVDDIDVTEMAPEIIGRGLMGYPILQPYNGADCIRPLCTGFTAYGSEYDGKLRFHSHGESIEIVLDPQDFIEGSETDKSTREQALEYPRLLSITAIDPTQDYIARPQTERRITPDVRAIGEESMQVPIVMTPDHQRQLASIGMKVSWARAQGTQEFSVPYATDTGLYLYLVAGKPFALDGKRYIAANVQLEDGEIHFEAKYDRQSAYTSNVTATPALPPTPPPSSIGGVTLFAALNLPVLRDQDDQVGLYFAVAGLLNSWAGCLLQVSADDQASWQTAIASMTESSAIGYLTDALPLASASGDDITNTLSVAVHGGELNSITRLQFLNEGNPCAIVKAGNTGECEVLSFQTADETAADEYDLTTLCRGALATAPAAHAQGARFVSLESVYFWQVPSALIGRTLWFRPVTFGTSPDNNAAYPIVFQPAVSQTEWPVTYLTGRYTGSAFVASIIPRHRLGNDITPIASANFIGYQWTLDDGDPTHAQSFVTAEPSAVFELSTFDSPATITVAALNRFTGPGPSESIVI